MSISGHTTIPVSATREQELTQPLPRQGLEVQFLALPLCKDCLRAPSHCEAGREIPATPGAPLSRPPPFFLLGSQSSPRMACPSPSSQLSPSSPDSLMAVLGLFLPHQL